MKPITAVLGVLGSILMIGVGTTLTLMVTRSISPLQRLTGQAPWGAAFRPVPGVNVPRVGELTQDVFGNEANEADIDTL